MAPRFKFTKEEMVDIALNLVRENGIDSLTARTLASKLGTSPKPIFGLFKNMEELAEEVISASKNLYNSYLENDMNEGIYPPYKASGMAYIRFAREEKELFKLLFMRDRSDEAIEEKSEEIQPILDIIIKNLNITEEEAILFHTELWIYTHGIATMIATSYLNWDLDFISSTLTDIYNGLKEKFAR